MTEAGLGQGKLNTFPVDALKQCSGGDFPVFTGIPSKDGNQLVSTDPVDRGFQILHDNTDPAQDSIPLRSTIL